MNLVEASCLVDAYLVDHPFLEDHLEDQNLEEPYLVH